MPKSVQVSSLTSRHQHEAASLIGTLSDGDLQRQLVAEVAQALADMERRTAKAIADAIEDDTDSLGPKLTGAELDVWNAATVRGSNIARNFPLTRS